MRIEPVVLRSVRSVEAAVSLLKQLGYDAPPGAVDTEALGIGSYPRNALVRNKERRREGYAVLVLEAAEPPRSLASLGKRLLLNLHDRPLVILGVPGIAGGWDRFVLIRPRRVRTQDGSGTAYRAAKLEVVTGAPTRHDAEVVERLRWDPSAADPQAEVDKAFDVEAVTREFFRGLRRHADAVRAALERLAERDTAARHGIDQAHGPDRVTIRLVSQLLFCWFLQRKGLLAGDPNYLVTRWRRKRGPYYRTELEPLFYETLNTPVDRRRPGRPGPEVPFLNGGLFDRAYGDVSLDLHDSLFHPQEGLLGYLTRWTFTISEEAPDEVDVAVDPELLGRVFENLVSDEELSRHGVVYTPRPVVQFMVREALAAWMADALGPPDEWARRLLVDDSTFQEYAKEHGTAVTVDLCRRLAERLDELTIIDPAVGSGAFILGALAEITRLRSMIHECLVDRRPDPDTLRAWKLHAIQRTLFGVDIEPAALELCRLRLWLSLLTDVPEGGAVSPLPNLEHRTVAADSLTDFVSAIPVQDTRHRSQPVLPIVSQIPDARRLSRLRERYFETYDPAAKERLREEIRTEEDRLVDGILSQAEANARGYGDSERASTESYVRELRRRYSSRDHVYPALMPDLHAPDVVPYGGWDIVIMNPPYLGKKEVARKVPFERRRDYLLHHQEGNDLMVLFGYRADQLVRDGGVVSMIFNDSVFTSTDSMRLRVQVAEENELVSVARTRCFEGVAVNGGVVVWRRRGPREGSKVRWVENYKRDPRDLAGASDPLAESEALSGETEILVVPAEVYRKVPGRPLFRPSPAAVRLIDWFRAMVPNNVGDEHQWWLALAQQPALNPEEIRRLSELPPGTVVPLGYCVLGGQGLATADDRYFLAAVEGSREAEECLRQREVLVEALSRDPVAAPIWRRLLDRHGDEEAALLDLHENYEAELSGRRLPWPRLLRVAPKALVRTTPITEDERLHGIASGPYFVPFEKGDRSDEDARGYRIAAAWFRENPIVLDWSQTAVALLRARARQGHGHRKPYLRNERLWGQGGVTWNGVARYLRARLVPEGSIFGHMAPLLVPKVAWLDTYGLLAFLNTDTADFIVRTFLGSLMHIEIGDIRRIPVPVLSAEQASALSEFGRRAVEATKAGDDTAVRRTQEELNRFVRRLYGIDEGEELWVAR